MTKKMSLTPLASEEERFICFFIGTARIECKVLDIWAVAQANQGHREYPIGHYQYCAQ